MPQNATNKNVTFTTTNNKIAVSETGLLTFSEAFEGARIKITTEDGNKTDYVDVQTYTEQAQFVAYDYTTNSINLDNSQQVKRDEDVYVLYTNISYGLPAIEDITYELSLNEDVISITDDSNIFQTVGNGTFTLTIKKEGEADKTLNFKVVEKITILELPDAISEFETAPENYYIGSQNGYYFDYKTNAKSPAVEYSVYDGSNNKLEGSALSDVVTISSDNRTINFTSNAVGNKYKVRVASIYDEKEIEYTFSIIDAWNVRNHAELSLAFNDGASQKSKIVLTNNINVTNDDLYENFLSHNTYSTTYNSWKGIYTRYADLTMEGNGHQVSASSVGYFAKVGSGENDDFGHERPSLFQIANYNSNGTNLTMFKETYYTPEFRAMVNEIGDDPTYTNTSDETRLPIRQAQAEYVKSLYLDTNTTIPKVYINNVNMEGNGGKNVVDGSGTYMGFRSLCGIKAYGAKLYLNGCQIEKFLDGVKGDSALSISLENCNVGNMSGFDIYTTRTRYLTIKNSTLGEAGHVATLMTPAGSDTYVDRFTKYDGVYAFEESNSTYYDSTTGLPLSALNPAVTNTKDGAVDTNGQVLKLVGDVVFNNWFDLKGPFLERDVTSYTSAQTIKSFLTSMLGARSSIIFKNYTESNKDDALLNYAIQLESAGKPTNYTYLDRTELNSDTKYTDSYDATTFHKLILKEQVSSGLPATVTSANINNSRINSEMMCVGVNFKKLQNMGTFYLSSIIVGINKDSNFHLA